MPVITLFRWADIFDELRIFTGNANPKPAQAIRDRLSIPIGDITVTSFANDNIFVKLNESIREAVRGSIPSI